MITVTKTNSQYDVTAHDLMTLASRDNNKKRNFLFLSKVLGKHLAVNPHVIRASGFLLLTLLDEVKACRSLVDEATAVIKGDKRRFVSTNFKHVFTEETAIIGFAETATGLGFAMGSWCENVRVAQTTRKQLPHAQKFTFEEEHSHATTHYCYLDPDAIPSIEHVILVDDELTTGKSMINIMQALLSQHTFKRITVLALLDWRTAQDRQRMLDMATAAGVELKMHALLNGEIEHTPEGDEQTKGSEPQAVKKLTVEVGIDGIVTLSTEPIPYHLKLLGGMVAADYQVYEKKMRQIGDTLNELLELTETSRVLVLGQGEDMYMPSQLACQLNGHVEFKTTTRSPIAVKSDQDYPIHDRGTYELDGVTYYCYNINDYETRYDVVLMTTSLNKGPRVSKNQQTISIW